MASIFEILSLDSETRKSQYRADGENYSIAYVTIDGDKYENYGQFSFMWEKSYVKPPSRSTGFVISNLNAHATGIVGHLYLDFSLMSIDDYRSIIKKDLEKNEFLVTCYDPIYNKRISLNMYLATPERAKLRTIANRKRKNDGTFEEWIELVGVEEYTIELIGTNTDVSKVSVVYHLNPPSELGIGDQTEGEDDVAKGTEIIIGNASTFPDYEMEGYEFDGWSIYTKKSETNGNYIDGNAYTINSDLVLYAQWKPTANRTLTYSYGLSEPMYSNGQPVYSKTVQEGQSIGDLPTFDAQPQVKYNDTIYYPYSNGGWYKTATKGLNSEKLTNGTIYWQNSNSMIYLLYDTNEYKLNLNADMQGISFKEQLLKYGDNLSLPTLVVSGYEFLGWYNGETKFTDTTMPPFNLSLIAKWKKN